MARIELSNIGGGGTTLSLTTTGTSGASTLAGSVLNIPVYQGQLTLTTTGTSGAATLSGDILNIPNYATGGNPAGSAGQVQFNSTPSGSFAASANLAWDNTAVQLNIGAPSTPTGKLNVKGGGATSLTVNLRLTNSGNTQIFSVADDGTTSVGSKIVLSDSYITLNHGSNNNITKIYPNPTQPNNFANISFYPGASAADIGQSITIVPKGGGLVPTLRASISVFNTDLIADGTNYEFFTFRAAGTSFFAGSGANGSGTVRPVLFAAGSNSNMWVNANGTVSLNKTSTNYQLDVTAASTFDGFRVVGSNSASGRVALQVQSSTATLYNIDNDGKISYLATNTAAGTTGAQTINRPSGTVNFAAGATALVVTNSLCTTASIVLPVIRTNDATAQIKNVVPAAGSFTINLSAAATAETSVGFFIIN